VSRKLVVGGVALGLVLVLGAVAAYAYYFTGLRTSPKPLSLSQPSGSHATASPGSNDLAGSWALSRGSVVRYRVKEQFVNQTSPHEAVAETSEASGGFTIQQSPGTLQATGVKFVTHLSNLQSIDQVAGYNVTQRDRFVSRTLDVQSYPDATFQAQTVSIPTQLSSGATVSVTMTGQLTIHGTTRDAEVHAQGRLVGNQLQINASTQFDMRDFGITPPVVPFTRSEPQASIECLFILGKAAGSG
jgi:polyisoprenoid-binding protein YceI